MSATIIDDKDDNEIPKSLKCKICDGTGYEYTSHEAAECWSCRGTGIQQNFYPDGDDLRDEMISKRDDRMSQ